MYDCIQRFRLPHRVIFVAIVSMFAAAIVAASAPPALAWDLGKLLNNKSDARDKFQVIHVSDLAALMAEPNDHVNIYDANGWGLRSTAGIIPGAHLLASDDKYDVAAELPADKSAKLVFYCADTH
jgi:rhodanese-related sulfurtransferase